MRFKDVFGQETIKKNLQRAIQTGRISHAYILNGEKGMGKHDMAEAFAAALLCERHGEDACGECRNCRRVAERNHPDVIWIRPQDKEKAILAREIRERLNNDMAIRPYESDHKIYIIEEAHNLRREGQNAILKTIEEPPEYGIVLLLADNLQGLLPTILSRCVKLDFVPEKDSKICARLEERGISHDQASMLAAYALGNLGKAIRMAEDEEFIDLHSDVMDLIKNVSGYDDADVLQRAEYLSEKYKGRLNEMIDLLEVWYRDVLLYKSTDRAEGLMLGSMGFQIRQHAKAQSFRQLGNINEAIKIANERARSKSADSSGRLITEQLLLSIKENS